MSNGSTRDMAARVWAISAGVIGRWLSWRPRNLPLVWPMIVTSEPSGKLIGSSTSTRPARITPFLRIELMAYLLLSHGPDNASHDFIWTRDWTLAQAHGVLLICP